MDTQIHEHLPGEQQAAERVTWRTDTGRVTRRVLYEGAGILVVRPLWQVLLLTSFLAPLFLGWPILPLQDLPDWVFQAELFREWLAGRLAADYEICSAIPPNALTTVVLSGAASLIGMEKAARALALFAALLIPVGMIRLFGSSDPRSPRAWIPLLYGLSYPLLHGNLNSAVGLGAFLIAAAWLLECADEDALPSAWGSVLVPTLLYATHGIAYAVWLALISATPLTGRARRRLALGVAPSVLIALHYVAHRSGAGDAVMSWDAPSIGAWTIYKTATLYKQLAPLALFDPFFVSRPLLWSAVLVNWVVVIALIAIAAIKLHKACSDDHARPSDRSKRVMVIGLFVAFLVAPKALGGLVNPGERLVLPIVALALSLPHALELRAGVHRMAASALAAALAAQVIFVGLQGHRAGIELAALLRATAALQGNVQLVHEHHLRGETLEQRSEHQRDHAALPRHYPLLRAVLYAAAAQKLTVPIFETGLFEGRADGLLIRNLAKVMRARDTVVVGEPLRVGAIARALRASEQHVASEYFLIVRATHARPH